MTGQISQDQRDQLTADLERVKQQEALLVFDEFDEDTALKLGLLVRAKAEALGAPIVVDIRRGDDVIFFTAMPGTSPANADWARRKRNLVNILHEPSYCVGAKIKMGSNLLELMGLGLRDHAPHGGCFPIRVKGAGMIGTVTVSGLPQRDDHKLATDAIAEMIGVDLGENGF